MCHRGILCTTDQDLYNVSRRVERKVRKFLLDHLKKPGHITDEHYKRFYPNGTHIGVLYGLPKVHKDGVPMRPICSVIGTSTYQLGKYVSSIIRPAASSSLGTDLNSTFQFVNQIREQDLSSSYMVSFDVRSLFTNVPLNKTIDICLDRLYRGDPGIKLSIPEDTLRELLKLCVCENTFVFNGKIYQQIDGVAMGSSLGPLLANIYMAHLEKEYFLKYKHPFSPSFYRRYVDDTFCIFRDENHIDLFLGFINSIDESIQFDKECEIENSLPFLDTIIKRNLNNVYPDISTRVKPTDKGLFYNFQSFIPESYKSNLIYILVYRIFHITSSYIIFDIDRRILKAKFLKNGFPSVLFDLTVGKFLDKLYTPEEVVATVKRMRVTMVLPYLGPLSVFIKRRLTKLVTKFYPLVDLKIIYKRGRTIGSMFPYKDNFPLKCNSSVVYKIECESCGSSATYVGKTINTIHERFYGANEHLHPSTKSTALLDHLAANVTPTCEFNTNNIKILDACTGDLKLRFAESIHLKHSKQTLNTQERSIPLKII